VRGDESPHSRGGEHSWFFARKPQKAHSCGHPRSVATGAIRQAQNLVGAECPFDKRPVPHEAGVRKLSFGLVEKATTPVAQDSVDRQVISGTGECAEVSRCRILVHSKRNQRRGEERELPT
jgi:hypothetical protein